MSAWTFDSVIKTKINDANGAAIKNAEGKNDVVSIKYDSEQAFPATLEDLVSTWDESTVRNMACYAAHLRVKQALVAIVQKGCNSGTAEATTTAPVGLVDKFYEYTRTYNFTKARAASADPYDSARTALSNASDDEFLREQERMAEHARFVMKERVGANPALLENAAFMHVASGHGKNFVKELQGIAEQLAQAA